MQAQLLGAAILKGAGALLMMIGVCWALILLTPSLHSPSHATPTDYQVGNVVWAPTGGLFHYREKDGNPAARMMPAGETMFVTRVGSEHIDVYDKTLDQDGYVMRADVAEYFPEFSYTPKK